MSGRSRASPARTQSPRRRAASPAASASSKKKSSRAASRSPAAKRRSTSRQRSRPASRSRSTSRKRSSKPKAAGSSGKKKAAVSEELYAVRDILDKRMKGASVEYLVDWQPDARSGRTYAPTWEPAQNFADRAMLAAFEKRWAMQQPELEGEHDEDISSDEDEEDKEVVVLEEQSGDDEDEDDEPQNGRRSHSSSRGGGAGGGLSYTSRRQLLPDGGMLTRRSHGDIDHGFEAEQEQEEKERCRVGVARQQNAWKRDVARGFAQIIAICLLLCAFLAWLKSVSSKK